MYPIDHPGDPMRRFYLCALLTLLPAAVAANDAINRIMATAEENHSTGVVIMQNGKIVAEQYWRLDESSDPRIKQAARARFFGTTDDGLTLEDVASVQKSVVAALAGIGQEKGLIDFDTSVSIYLGDKWASGEPAAISRITIRHLMSQTSGLDEKLAPEAEPGTRWRYNTTAYQNVLRVLEAASGLDKNELTKTWLTNDLGMQDTYWLDRASRNSKGPPQRGLVTHARDLARFGQFVLDKGRANGHRLIKEETLAELMQPSSTMNPSYGLLWWLNSDAGYQTAGNSKLQEGRREPMAPANMVSARGALNRLVLILPDQQLVITRTGLINTDKAGNGFAKVWWDDLRHLLEQDQSPAGPK